MKVIAHSYIHANGAYLNGQRVIEISTNEENYLKSIYSQLSIDYPKFYKMDNLSKLAFLADFLLKDFISESLDQENRIQLIFANSGSSQRTDQRFIDSYSNLGSPSPSLFVYTLPNILTGELSIRHKWYGENCFFIEEEFNVDFFMDQIQFSFNRGNNLCLCGWVESIDGGSEESFLFLVSNEQGEENTENILKSLKSYRNE
jgi:hypothetical protein